ncbi:MAG: hypothetical protein KatS3mg096_756 [Candidatus Parcubacteria bacterium]|nr:MAG: hypothetical protein KatS3mg096_756 [Candidatus Parcubacteria bacterium]
MKQIEIERVKFSELANFTEKQRFFLETTKFYDYVLFSGTRGSGKSYALRWTALYWLLRWAAEGHNQVRAGLFCETYPTLYDRHLQNIKKEFPSWLGDFHEQKKEFILKDKYGGGILALRNLDEPAKYQGFEFALVAVDELTRNPKSTFDLLRSSLRWPGIERTKFIAATNPYGEHLRWVRQLWIERNFPPELEHLKDQFYVVYAQTTDNPYLPKEYWERLATLPEAERRAFLEGDWYAFEGQVDESGYMPLIISQDLENALINDEPNLWTIKPKIMGVDVGAGGDRSVIVLRNDLGAKILFAERLKDTMNLVGIIGKLLVQYEPNVIAVDITGVGRGVADRLSEIGFSAIIREVNFGAKPLKQDFRNKKAELYWNLKDWLKQGGKLVKNELWNQLLEIRYKILSDKAIMIEPKENLLKKGFGSPDVVDALALTFTEDLSTLRQFLTLREIEL